MVKKVIILLDEYDTPLQEAYVHGYWRELVAFTRSLFNASFKTNPYLERAIMTGITRVSKESIFSDLNNLVVVTTTSEAYADSLGFTEQEVFAASDEYGMEDKREEVKDWYDGFTFGERRDIYNSWSISIWSLLLASGYLCVESVFLNMESGRKEYDLALTNKEVRLMFDQIIGDWFREYTLSYSRFVKALLAGNTREMNYYMNRVALDTFSFFDSGNRPSVKSEPECFYHGFVLGLLVELRGGSGSQGHPSRENPEIRFCFQGEGSIDRLRTEETGVNREVIEGRIYANIMRLKTTGQQEK